MEKTIINWGVIGCAGIADKAVIPGITAAKNALLYGIASRNKQKLEDFKDRHKPLKVFETYEELLDDPNIDAVYIPLPNSLHYKWVLKAASKKKHILCEKPLGINARQILSMKEECEKNGVLLMEAFAYRHSPLTLKVKSLIVDGEIGDIKHIESSFTYRLPDMSNSTNIRLSKELSGGSVYDIGCYNINVIRYLAGSEPTSVCAYGDIGGKSQVDESCCILMAFENGLTAVSYSSMKCIPKVGYTVVGESGIIEVPVKFNEEGSNKLILKNSTGTQEIFIECPDNYMLEVEQFGRCILNDELPLVTIEDSYHNSKVIDIVLNQMLVK